ncbi:MAG: carboxylating nicotinate-nucleotide diphosphorylase, partial [Bradymonadaceae bacterium]
MPLTIGPQTRRLVDMALDEDAAARDPSAAVFPPDHTSTAELVAKRPLVVAGQPVADLVFARIDSTIEFEARADEGQRLESGDLLGTVAGPTASLLRAERTALNFLQRLSGIATKTARYVEALGDPTTAIVDTRKTLPGFRHLDKYAVRCGGGHNHRFDLGGGVIVKDNHIAAAGGIAEAIAAIRDEAPHLLKIEVEVERLDGVDEQVMVLRLGNPPDGEYVVSVIRR